MLLDVCILYALRETFLSMPTSTRCCTLLKSSHLHTPLPVAQAKQEAALNKRLAEADKRKDEQEARARALDEREAAVQQQEEELEAGRRCGKIGWAGFAQHLQQGVVAAAAYGCLRMP